MALKTKKQLVASRSKTYAGNNPANYITIHETANTDVGANAQTHANLQSNGFTAAWHWQVDDKEAIQSFPHSVRCWHAGDGEGKGNYESIGIEICVNSDGDFSKAVDNAVKLVRKIMVEEGISVKDVVQHNHWSGKNCPTYLRNGSKGITWADFISAVKGGSKPSKPAKPTQSKPSKKPNKAYTGDSIVDYLNSIDVDSSLSNRSKLASKHGIKGYKGTEAQNLRLLKALRDGKASSKPKPKAKLTVDGKWGKDTTKALQKALGTAVDGIISRQPRNSVTQSLYGGTVSFAGGNGSPMVRALQKKMGARADGKLGPSTVRALQKYLGTTQDGVLSRPSLVVKELQKKLNSGTF